MAKPEPKAPDPLAGIERRLDIVVRLLSAQLTRGMTRKEEILTLSAAGLAPKEIASMLGISSNQVSVAVYGAKQRAAKKRKQTGKKAKDGDQPTAS